MFIIVQFPFSDFRSIVKGKMGRLDVPDWASDNLNSGFVRGFGKICSRNGSGLGLGGEHAFADMNQAIRFDPNRYKQEGWITSVPIPLWFRRLYYDGEIAGRFEIGFLMPEDEILDVARDTVIDPQRLAQTVLSKIVHVHSVEGLVQTTELKNCGDLLGLAYVASTTRNDALKAFPIKDTYGSEVFVGKPVVHIRVPSDLRIQTNRDRRPLAGGNEPEFFITSALDLDTRNNVVVQASSYKLMNESPSERVTRVLFAHLNSLLFAHARFVETGRDINGHGDRDVLRQAIGRMLERFGRFTQIEGSQEDKEFTEGIRLFAKAHAGRIEQMVGKLEELSAEWSKPTILESLKLYVKSLHDLTITTAVKTAVETTIKQGR